MAKKAGFLKPIQVTSYVHPTDKAMCINQAMQTVNAWRAQGSYPPSTYTMRVLVGELTSEAKVPEPEFVEVPIKEMF